MLFMYDCSLLSDVDECETRINNCVEGAMCKNTHGDFRCLCPGPTGMIDCTGMCKRREVLIENGGWRIDNCINCTCLVSVCLVVREQEKFKGEEEVEALKGKNEETVG